MSEVSTMQLLENFKQAVREAIVVPNSWLPEDEVDGIKWSDNVRGGRTLARLEQLCDKRDGNTEVRKEKAIKMANAELYRQQIEAGQEIDYSKGQQRVASDWSDNRKLDKLQKFSLGRMNSK